MKNMNKKIYSNATDNTINIFHNCNEIKEFSSCSKICPRVISITINDINIFKYSYKCPTYHEWRSREILAHTGLQ